MNDAIIEEVKYYIEHNVTKKDVAKAFGRSLSSIKKDFAKFKNYAVENPEWEYYDLYLSVISKANFNEQIGKINGGKKTNSGKKRILSIKETLEVAKYIVQNAVTLRVAEEKLTIPRSTIYDSIEQLKKCDDEEIKSIYQSVKDNYISNKANAVYNISEGISEIDGKTK